MPETKLIESGGLVGFGAQDEGKSREVGME